MVGAKRAAALCGKSHGETRAGYTRNTVRMERLMLVFLVVLAVAIFRLRKARILELVERIHR